MRNPRVVRVGEEQTDAGEKLEYTWYAGNPGPFEGIIVIRTDRFGQRWELRLQRGSFVTIRVAAGLLGVTPMTVSNWLRSGQIKHGRAMGKGATVIPLNEVERVARSKGIQVPWPGLPHEEGGSNA